MGAWVDRVPKTAADGWRRRRVVFLGHLVERQGVHLLLDALARLRSRGAEVSAAVIGGGPLLASLRERVEALGLGSVVTLHGFVEDHRDVEALLADASVAVAPYEPTPETFTRFADPGKLKAYLAAGLPTLLTDVPPNASTLQESAGAEVVRYDADDLATAIERLLATPAQWRERRAAALEYSESFDWRALLGEVVEVGSSRRA
jgi:glycosyltransferase involved in cell wall biosynthesis